VTTYRDAGVDTARADRAVDRVLQLARRTFIPGVRDLPWGFAGLFDLKAGGLLDRMPQRPLLAACADGAGTKVKIAAALGRHRGIGVDVVAMNVNDLICVGARPLFFLDYFACGRLDPAVLAEVVEGIVDGCRQAGCALLGGETAEMPGVYAAGDYDVAGFAVGVVEERRVLDGRRTREGDDVIGLASSGVHANGFSLVRRVFADADFRRPDPELGAPLGEVLLTPTRIYVRALFGVLRHYRVRRAVRAVAHITGEGIAGNVPRVLPEGFHAEIARGSWPVPPIFERIRRAGSVDEEEMYAVFNMGIGFVMITHPASTAPILRRLRQMRQRAWRIGRIVRGAGEPSVRWVRSAPA
jgi:phosphoribosylformylglycinamidine cyclo-ligase